MVRLDPVEVDGRTVTGITVELPGTRLVVLATRSGYLMCGALDVALLSTRLAERRIVAGRTLGVRTYEDLLERPLESVTPEAGRLGLRPGMTGREALGLLLAHEEAARAGRGSTPAAGGTPGSR